MLVNDNHNFLFVHIQKTAGSSITDVLSKTEKTKKLVYAHSMVNTIDITKYQNYYKFCFVRNPFDRLVSWYNMLIHKKHNNDWSKYVLQNSKNFSGFLDLTDVIMEKNLSEKRSVINYPKSISFNQLDYITDVDGNIVMDHIGRFENLVEDFDIVMKNIGINKYHLPHINKYKHKNYREYYTDKDIEKVYAMYKRDIEYFNYNF